MLKKECCAGAFFLVLFSLFVCLFVFILSTQSFQIKNKQKNPAVHTPFVQTWWGVMATF